MTESKKYQEVVERIAKELALAEHIRWEDAIQENFLRRVRELLDLKHPCPNPNCKNGEIPMGLYNKYAECPDCEGTGKSKVPLLAVTDPNQSPKRMYDKSEEVESFTEEAVQQDMIAHGWVKTLKEKK